MSRYRALRSRAETEWEELVESGQAEGQKAPEIITAIMQAVADAWAAETDEFRESLTAERDAEVAEAKEGAKKAFDMEDLMAVDGAGARTPEQYQKYVCSLSILSVLH